jgi:hypothetical protein
MTSFSVTSFKKAISEFKENSTQCLNDPVKRPDAILCREYSDSPACIRPDVRITPSGRSSVFEKNPDSFADLDWEDNLQPSKH